MIMQIMYVNPSVQVSETEKTTWFLPCCILQAGRHGATDPLTPVNTIERTLEKSREV